MKDSFDVNSLPQPRGNGHTSVDAGFLMRALASDLLTRSGWASQAGITFGGVRDLYAALGYKRQLTIKDHRDRYARGDIGARVVDVYPKSTWRGGIELIEDEDPQVITGFEEACADIDKRLHLWAQLQRADILAGLGRYAVLLIGAPGRLEEDLPQMRGPEDVLYLAPYAEDEATIDTTVEDPEDPRFGLPLTYKIKRASTRKTFDRIVHWSRVLHIADNVLDEVIYGEPRMQRVWNRLDDLDKVTGGGSEAFWIRVHQGTLLNVDPQIKIGDGEVKKLKEEAEEFVNGMRRFMTLRGVDMTQLGTDVSNFGPQVASIISIISGSTGIPQRLLLGSERGELASTQDKDTWNERVSDRRTEYAEPIVRELVDRLLDHGALPEPEQYDVRWPEIEELDEKDKAIVAEAWAGLNQKAGGPVVDPAEIRDRVLGLPELTDQQKKDLTPAPPPPPVISPGGTKPVPPDQQAEADQTRVQAQ